MNADDILQRTRILLGDAQGVKFTDAQLETALSQVLAVVNTSVPHVVVLAFNESVEDHILPLPDEATLRNVLRVECVDFDPPKQMAFRFDVNQPGQIELLVDLQAVPLQWRVHGVRNHQIQGLDGAEVSTIPNHCEMLLASGTAAYALQIRKTQLAESANQENTHFQALQENFRTFEGQFQRLIMAWQSAQVVDIPVLPDGESWPLDE